MSSRVDDLNLFLRVFDAGSISAAARSLDLSVAVASQRLRSLEISLGVRLFHRTTRSLTSTDEGLALAAQGRPLVDDLQALMAGLRQAGTGVSGTLRMTTSATFARQYVSPLLPEFMRQHPQLRLSLDVSDQVHDLVTAGFDLALRIGALEDSSLVARQLAVNRRVLCASPDYLRRRGPPARPEELAQHDCLILVGSQGRADVWRMKDKRGREVAVRVDGALESSQGEVLRDAAVAGMGIAMHSTWHVADDLRAGRLAVVLPDCKLPETGIHAVMPQRRLVPARVTAFVDFMAEKIGGVSPWERDEKPPRSRKISPAAS
ncbi:MULTISPECIES: LysR family transcriptional regulator [unclassified Roseateles]|uniref:LysR family transcriptional regulator n=1 Tax=unclassified Roseateles TaxID=2626991 RepID=UPI0006F2EBEF|nr:MULTISPECIES: LysR family transcriptional regulator [unclassified Roseateles]KQW51932.1 LysR family transcriptional regulator [Pelomonas sp. Root405]KRA78165.1 LysR family transcriptional regulator [Pelomonas sp. Root662]